MILGRTIQWVCGVSMLFDLHPIRCTFYLHQYKCYMISPSIWSNVWIVLPKPSRYEFLFWVKVFTSHNIFVILSMFVCL